MPPAAEDLPRASRLADNIADATVKEVFFRLLDELSSLHGEMKLVVSNAEVRVHYRDTLICRMVPYRELLHLTIGEEPGWEVRIRRAQESMEALDRIIDRFLSTVAGDSFVG